MDLRNDSGLVKRERCANRAWGFVADQVDDAPPCIAECRGRFLSDVLPENETFERVCEMLQDSASEGPFRALYCCDAQICGVDHLQKAEQDPTVNWLIDSCRNIGFDSIEDPGPPDSTYICGQGSGYDGGPWCQDEKTTGTETALIVPESSSSTAEATRKLATTDIPSSVASQDKIPDPTTSEATGPSDTGATHVSDTQDGTKSHQGMSAGVKAAIGIAVAVVFVAVVVLLFCLWRRRKARRRNSEREEKKLGPLPPSRPVSKAVSQRSSYPDSSIPLTPPARLQERRLLPTSLANVRYVPATMPEQHGFPLSPVFSPMSGKLSPRQERIVKRKNGSNSLASSVGATIGDVRNTPVQYVLKATVDSPTSTRTSSSPVRSGKPSPTRPSRLGDQSLAITELVSPGPPPKRALPSTPPIGIGTFANSPPQKTRPPVSPNTPIASPSQDSVLSPDSQAGRPMSKDQPRELRNSW
ncbi:hypothetical protein B0T10DRAFT_462049 [Thelonectria olida]|uniref:Uncharacterized protein n=1 Tax=Thelonectria olida TaxID=1576542 RepID=A0A9P8VZQ1_9HYPO|nr:hypothetical protein B0T10DRAFT_462049 [Thelonectria olida]